jgi:hypothetical protein
MNVCMSAQLYHRRNHTSQAIPSPEATLLVATALRAYESTLNIESGDIDFSGARGLYSAVDPEWRCISGLPCDILGESRVLIYMVDEQDKLRDTKDVRGSDSCFFTNSPNE